MRALGVCLLLAAALTVGAAPKLGPFRPRSPGGKRFAVRKVARSGVKPVKQETVKSVFDVMGFGRIRRQAQRQAAEPGHRHMFNGFRILGDMLHLASFAFLIYHLLTARNCAGVSLKSQELFLAVFLCRYIDIFWNFISLYNTVMKLLYIGMTVYIIYMMRVPLRRTLTKEPRAVRHCGAIVGGCALLALLYNDTVPNTGFSLSEVMWSFSIYLEAVAIIPQMEVLGRVKLVKNLTSHYLFALGGYRVLYLINFAYRYSLDPVSSREFIIKAIGAVVQMTLYIPFMVMYFNNKMKRGVAGDVVVNEKMLV